MRPRRIAIILVLAGACVLPGCADTTAGLDSLLGLGDERPLRQLPVLDSPVRAAAPAPKRPDKAAVPVPARAKRPAVRRVVLGESVEGRTLVMYVLGKGLHPTFIFGAIHGDEPVSKALAQRMLDYLSAHPAAWAGRCVAVLPEVNPDGILRGTRQNARAVDCNRNFPATNWRLGRHGSRYYGGPSAASEPETQAIVKAVNMLRPGRIVSIHSISDGRHCNNYDGPARELAEGMAASNHYPPRGSIGYPTPGSFGTWAGIERRIPTITLELPAGKNASDLWPANRDALLAVIRDQKPTVGK